MNTILIIGSRTDPICDKVEQHLKSAGINYLFLDVNQGIKSFYINATSNYGAGKDYILYQQTRIDLEQVTGAFFRYLALPSKDKYPSENESFISSEFLGLIRFLSEKLEGNIINRIPFYLWGYSTLDSNLLKRIWPGAPVFCSPFQITLANECQSNDVLGENESYFIYRSFTHPREAFVFDNPLELKPLGNLFPLRLYPNSAAKIITVFVVGMDFIPTDQELSAPLLNDLKEISTNICDKLGLTFSKFRWILNEDGRYQLLNLELFPLIERKEYAILERLGEAILKNLIR